MALAEAGLKVLVLERGPRFLPNRDFPMNFPDWELRPGAFDLGDVDPTIVHEPGERLPEGTDDLCSRGTFGAGTACTNRSSFRYHRVHGLGGTTLHYQGEAHRFADYAFRPATSYGSGVDWPLSYQDLEPYYRRAERILGVAGDAQNPYKPSREDFPTPAHPFSRATRHVKRGTDELGWLLLPNSLALPTRSVDGRTPCQRSGGCVQGCLFGAKSSVDLTALRRGLRTGRLDIWTQTRVLQVEHDGKRASSVVCLRDGTKQRVHGKVVVLSAGAIESVRLLLASAGAGFPHGLANNNQLVGRYFLDTLLVSFTVRFDTRLEPYKGPPIDARVWDFALPPEGSSVRSGYVLGVSGTLGGFHGPLSYARAIPGIGLEHKRAMRERFGTILTLFGVAEHEPQEHNRLTLSDMHDETGIPKVHVRSSFSENDRAVFRVMIERCEEWARACGAVETLRIGSTYSQPSASQIGGGCRMGDNPDTSVVDSYGRAHELTNLFVADASVLAGQGAGDSPSLTIQALALRTAERIVKLMRRREL